MTPPRMEQRLRWIARVVAGRVFLAAQPLLANRLVVLKLTTCDHDEHWSLAEEALQHLQSQ